MNTGVHEGPREILLRAILSLGVGGELHSTSTTVPHAIFYTDKCLEAMRVGDVLGGGLGEGVDSNALTALLAKGLDCTVPEATKAVGRIMTRCVNCTVQYCTLSV